MKPKYFLVQDFCPVWQCPPPGYNALKIFCDNSSPPQPVADPASGKLWTAIGCIPVNAVGDFIVDMLGWSLGIGGGIALLLFAVSGIMIKSSIGDPLKVQAGRNLALGAIAGLMMLIFSAFILRFVGVDILGIPGL